MKIKKIMVIINPASGRGEAVLTILNQAMKEANIEWDIVITKKSGDGTRLAKEAISKKVDAIGVYGGDGTLMEVASGMINADIPLVILPGGSANVMATGLGIPKDLKEACRLICEGPHEIKVIDVGCFGKRYFIVGLSMGFEADMIKGADRETKNKIGIFAYVISAVKAFKKLGEVQYTITVDGKEEKVTGLSCSVVNAANLGFTNISLDKHIDISDGLLDVLVVRKANFNLFTHILITFIRRERPDNWELVAHYQGKDIKITSSPAQRIQCDGEPLEKIPIHAHIMPSVLRVIVPRPPKEIENKA
jgi:diacylglycerol kinase (ATP)